MEFENLKLLAKISDDHALEILQQNIRWDLMEKFIAVYGPLEGYEPLKSTSTNVGHANQYLKTIKHPTFTPFHPCVLIVQTPVRQLPQGVPMEVDWQQHLEVSTHPQAAFHSNCYNCGQADHLA